MKEWGGVRKGSMKMGKRSVTVRKGTQLLRRRKKNERRADPIKKRCRVRNTNAKMRRKRKRGNISGKNRGGLYALNLSGRIYYGETFAQIDRLKREGGAKLSVSHPPHTGPPTNQRYFGVNFGMGWKRRRKLSKVRRGNSNGAIFFNKVED